jgi:ribonuclease BN (tRNA processing enzyme)
MTLKKKEFFLLIFLIFLQSCSGGRIGNFLESSFNDLEKTSENENIQNNLLNKNDINLEKENKKFDDKKIKKVEKPKNVPANKNDINLEKRNKKFDDKKNKKIKNLSKKRKIELQSYKIIFILKDVDPKDPTAELSTILSNSEVNFEIEKIERILDSKNKIMNKN